MRHIANYVPCKRENARLFGLPYRPGIRPGMSIDNFLRVLFYNLFTFTEMSSCPSNVNAFRSGVSRRA